MCGIAGYIRSSGLLAPEVLAQMLVGVRHRGPDGERTWTRPADGLALAHSRLRVLDLTEAADQPMHSTDRTTTLIYNGEIYNFRELREALRAEGAAFQSTGDTEVLLELCRRRPDLSFLPRLSGMFAFALWHAPTKTLSLARDRTGVKPLLYAELPDGLAFASEMAAIRPAVPDASIDARAVVELLTLGFIAAPRTIFHQVHKLRPGHLLRFRHGRIEIRKWSTEPPATSCMTNCTEACDRLRGAFADAVAKRLVADVPVGVFLSGGIDSAITTAVAARQAAGRVKTFSVTFPGHPYYDESAYSRAVAEMHGTDHTALPLSLDDIRNVIPEVQAHLGEPFADSSALPTFLLSKLTRRHVTVALSGDGADELFAGYNRYAAATLFERMGWLARTPFYRPLRGLIERLPAKRETRLGAVASQMKRAIRSMDPRPPHRFANWMRTSDDRTLARLLHDPRRCPPFVEDIVQLLWDHRGEPRDDPDLNHHLRTEWRLSLPDDMLTKVDLMSMAHGLEVRSPFLDNEVVDLVFPLPWEWKLRRWKKKHLLIEAFKDDLPPILHSRPKKGFEVPVGPWLRGPLNAYARDLIAADRCFFGTLLSREGATDTLDDHTAGRADHNFCLWALVSLLAWQQQHARTVSVAPAR
jgi:asparagine synthase (glutamine-hydrolysing)